ncbi:MFS transporter [Thermococcus alcaliphilus]|uniref:MFS transporter n=1 Tax=Thermococcus alcaliphilus TaxID=139207 RepID=UPI002091A066|nr:MFS transporter [Thermococcus alcaliphilus]MCO6041397.1 MFS transporter [Thermococcus alcaliphilus]
MEFDESYVRRATPLLAFTTLIVLYAEAMLIPSIPRIQAEFGVTPAEASWILAVYFLSGTIFAMVFGRLGDVYGRKKLLITALSFFTLAVLFNAFVPSFHAFIAFRALQGVGMATAPLAYALVREQFPREKAPFAQGLISAMNGLGLIIALPLGGFIAEHYGWRVTFWSVFPFSLILIFLIAVTIRESRAGKAEKEFDWPGAALFALSASSLLILISNGPQWGIKSEKTVLTALTFILSSVALIMHERRSEVPLIPLSISDRNISSSLIAAFLAAVAFQVIFLTLTYLFQSPKPYGYGVESSRAGSLMIPMVVAYMLSAPLGGKLVVRVGAKVMGIAGGAVASIAYLILALSSHMGLGVVLALIAAGASGMALLNVAVINTLTFSAPREVLGASTGLFTTFRSVGSSLGPSIGGAVLSALSLPMAFKVNFLLVASSFALATSLFLSVREVVKG